MNYFQYNLRTFLLLFYNVYKEKCLQLKTKCPENLVKVNFTCFQSELQNLRAIEKKINIKFKICFFNTLA